ncbi:hypothetical protein ABTN27_20705, partial [Acinetobacter baumannii]
EIVRRQGKGTFVAEPKVDLTAGGLVRMLGLGNPRLYDVEVLDAQFAAVEKSVAAKLGDAKVLRIDWLLQLRGAPTAIAYSFLRPGAIP